MPSAYTNDINEEKYYEILSGFKDYYNNSHDISQGEILTTYGFNYNFTPASADDGSVTIQFNMAIYDGNSPYSYLAEGYVTKPVKNKLSEDDLNKTKLSEYLPAAEKAIDDYYGPNFPTLDDYSVRQRVMEAVHGSGITVDVKSSETKNGNMRYANTVCTLTLGNVTRTISRQWSKYVETPDNEKAARILSGIQELLLRRNFDMNLEDIKDAAGLKSVIENAIGNYNDYTYDPATGSSTSNNAVKDYGVTYDVKVTSFEEVENSGTAGEVSAKFSADITLREPATGETLTFTVENDIVNPDKAWYDANVRPFVDEYIAGIEVSNDTTLYDINAALGKIRDQYNAKGGKYSIFNIPIVYDEEYFTLIPATEEAGGSVKFEFGVGANSSDWLESFWDSFVVEKTIPKLTPTDKPGNISSEPTVEPGAPATTVEMPSGSSAADMVELTPEEEKALQSGADLKLVLNVAPLVPDNETEAAVEQAAAGMNVGLYLDLSVTAHIEGSSSSRDVSSLKKAMTITVQLPEELISGVAEGFEREYYIIHAGDSSAQKCSFDSVTGKISFTADAFSPYAVAYKDMEKEKEPEPEPAPTVYNVKVVGGIADVKGSRTSGSEMTVTVDIGYEATVTSGRNVIAVISDGSGTFTMPASDVTVNVALSATAGHMLHYPNSYIFCYDKDMNHIGTNSSRYGINGTGDITVKLGADYAGRKVTLYNGRRSAVNKVDEGVLDSNGRCVFTVEGGKNFTLIVED